MSYGFDPYLSSWSPYHGAIYAVTRIRCQVSWPAVVIIKKIRFTFQEYFRTNDGGSEPDGASLLPHCSVLTVHRLALDFRPSVVKDSMSGTFNDIDVPPTLVSFAVDVAKIQDVITPEFKEAGNKLVWIHACRRRHMICRITKKSWICTIPLHADMQAGTSHIRLCAGSSRYCRCC